MHTTVNSRQTAFKEIAVGTLIWATVLGILNDYSDIVETRSFSYTLLAGLILQILTYVTLLAKSAVFSRRNNRPGLGHKTRILFFTWCILFFSKFVFLEAIDLIFGENVNVDGFINLILVILIVSILQRLADFAYEWLGRATFQPKADSISS